MRYLVHVRRSFLYFDSFPCSWSAPKTCSNDSQWNETVFSALLLLLLLLLDFHALQFRVYCYEFIYYYRVYVHQFVSSVTHTHMDFTVKVKPLYRNIDIINSRKSVEKIDCEKFPVDGRTKWGEYVKKSADEHLVADMQWWFYLAICQRLRFWRIKYALRKWRKKKTQLEKCSAREKGSDCEIKLLKHICTDRIIEYNSKSVSC